MKRTISHRLPHRSTTPIGRAAASVAASAAVPAVRRARRGLVGIAVAALIGAAVAMLPATPAAANVPDTTVTVDVSQPGKTPTHAGAGFLYGLSQDGSGPADSLLQPLAPTLFRGGGARISGGGWIGDNYSAGSNYRVRINSALSQARRVTTAPYSARYDLLVSDLYGADTTQPSNTVYPCDNGNCSNWKTFIDQVVGDVQSGTCRPPGSKSRTTSGTSRTGRGSGSAA